MVPKNKHGVAWPSGKANLKLAALRAECQRELKERDASIGAGLPPGQEVVRDGATTTVVKTQSPPAYDGRALKELVAQRWQEFCSQPQEDV